MRNLRFFAQTMLNPQGKTQKRAITINLIINLIEVFPVKFFSILKKMVLKSECSRGHVCIKVKNQHNIFKEEPSFKQNALN